MAQLSPPRRSLSSLLNSWTVRCLVLVPWLALVGTVVGRGLGGPSCIEGYGGNIGLEDTTGGACVLYFRFLLLVSMPVLCPLAAVLALRVAYVGWPQERLARMERPGAGRLAAHVFFAVGLCAWPAFLASWLGWLDTSGYGYSLWELANERGLRLHECVEGREFLGYVAGCVAGGPASVIAALVESGRFPRR
jgi:hypothetical protein